MALDAEVADGIKALILSGANTANQTGASINQNLAHGLGLVQAAVIQAQASNSDDPAVIAALNTASRSPAGLGSGS